jgi:RNA polymerase sigma factor (TIGR02999 family)
MTEVSRLLKIAEQGDPQAAEQLLPLVYDELRKLAARKLAQEKPGQTLNPTALVHEAYLRLVGGQPGQPWDGQRHFFAAAAEAMRRILIENARRKGWICHGGERVRVDLDEVEVAKEEADERLLALNDALDRFAQVDEKAAEIVKLRYFLGLTIEQAAEVLGISVRTANRHRVYARTWLYQELS